LYSSPPQIPASSLLCVHFPFPYSLPNLWILSRSVAPAVPTLCITYTPCFCAGLAALAYTAYHDYIALRSRVFVRLRVRARICIIRRQTSLVGAYPFSRLLTWPLYSVPAVARASPACKWSVCLRVADCCCRIGRCFRAARSCPSSCLNAGRRVFRETRVDPRRPTRPTCRQFCTRSARSNLIRLATAHFLTRPHCALCSLKWRLLPKRTIVDTRLPLTRAFACQIIKRCFRLRRWRARAN